MVYMYNYTVDFASIQIAWHEYISLCMCVRVDGFQISINHPTFRGQMHDQGAAVQWTLHLQRSSLFYLSALVVRTQCSASFPVLCTQLHRMHTLTLALWKWNHAPWKPSIQVCTYLLLACLVLTMYTYTVVTPIEIITMYISGIKPDLRT